MEVNPYEEAREAALNAIRVKIKCEQLETVVQAKLMPDRHLRGIGADLHSMSENLNRMAEKLLMMSYILPDRDIEIE